MKIFILMTTLLFSFSSFCESGPGNGTDSVKIIFKQAQSDLIELMNDINSKNIETLGLDPNHLHWLQKSNASQTTNRFEWMKIYLQSMELRFQYEGCSDQSKLPASICFYNETPTNPYVIISLDLNRETTLDLAMSMLVHEAGHFTGEMDHAFLDELGIDLVDKLKVPSVIKSTADSVITSGMIFIDEANCKSGQGLQADQLKNKIIFDLTNLCSERNLKCNTNNVQFSFDGNAVFEKGAGFTMKVYCKAEGLLKLR